MTATAMADRYFWALARLGLGWIFLWAFLDKLFGFGFSTKPGMAWLDGASPTAGFLTKGVYGPLATLYHQLAGSDVVSWLFMLGLLLIGLSLLVGVGTTIAGYSGALLMLLMYLALLPPKTNPILDDHLIYLFLLLGIALGRTGDTFGFGRWWSQTALVKNHPILR